MTKAPGIQRIIAATDLSECAGSAVSLAANIARVAGGELTVVHVHSPAPDYTSRVLVGEATMRDLADQKRGSVEAELDQHLATLQPVKRILLTGPTASQILAAADLVDADLIVVGTRGHGAIKRALLGSVAEAVILDSRRPVLSVRCGEPALPTTFRRIVCAVDYSAVSGNAFALASAFASTFSAQLSAVYVVDGPQVTDSEDERLRTWVRSEGVESKVLAREGNAATTLMEFAKERAADLLVIGAHRKVLSKKTSLGSTTTALTHYAHCPVLVVSAARADDTFAD
jgi:nucleotide-binding universal stress UspA family protein